MTRVGGEKGGYGGRCVLYYVRKKAQEEKGEKGWVVMITRGAGEKGGYGGPRRVV